MLGTQVHLALNVECCFNQNKLSLLPFAILNLIFNDSFFFIFFCFGAL